MPGEVFAAAAPAALIIGAFLVGVDALPCNGALFMLLRFDDDLLMGPMLGELN